jgi:hypothetical protein
VNNNLPKPPRTWPSRLLWSGLVPAVVSIAAVVIGFHLQDNAAAKRVRKALVPEILENQTALSWKLTLAMRKRNPPWTSVNADGELGIVKADSSEPILRWSSYEALKPELMRLGMDDMMSVVNYYRNLHSLERYRHRMQQMYADSMRDFYVEQDFETMFLPLCNKTFEVGNYLLGRFAGLSVPRNALGVPMTDERSPQQETVAP